MTRMAESRLDALAIALFAIATAALYAGFASNFWAVADDRWFETHQRDTESLVVGRLIMARRQGVLSSGGLPGHWIPEGAGPAELALPALVESQYALYSTGATAGSFRPYKSQTGGQGMVFSVLDAITEWPSADTLRLLRMVTAALTAAVLGCVIVWFYLELGVFTAILVFLSIALSPWVTVFARNLWWSLWAFYVPMSIFMYAFRFRWNSIVESPRSITVLAAVVVMVKIALTGFEYMTTALMMMLVPFTYYASKHDYGFKRAVRLMIKCAVGASFAVVVSLAVLSFQIDSVENEPRSGAAHIVDAFLKRTHGNPDDFVGRKVHKSLNAGTWSVVEKYLHGAFVSPPTCQDTRGGSTVDGCPRIPYWALVASLPIATWLLQRKSKRERAAGSVDRTRNALVLATWFSLLAPLSWFTLFKAHSHIHVHMNFITWHMPFVMFAAAMLACTLQHCFVTMGRRDLIEAGDSPSKPVE